MWKERPFHHQMGRTTLKESTMGIGKYKNGRYQPITPFEGSWADSEAKRNLTKPKPEILFLGEGLSSEDDRCSDGDDSDEWGE